MTGLPRQSLVIQNGGSMFTDGPHTDGKRFFYPGQERLRGLRDMLKWKLTSHAARWPKTVPVRFAAVEPAPAGAGMVVTWIGHATFLIQTAGSAWLTDPVFSTQIGPIKNFGPRRVTAPGIALPDLPPIDGVLLSHDHYDHCDLPSLRAIAARAKGKQIRIYAPLGHRALIEADSPEFQIREMDWWEKAEGTSGAEIEFVPSKHWCRRSLGGTNLRLWGGYYLRAGGRTLYFAGDSGFDEDLFRTVGKRSGPPDLALIPIGAYEPRWFMRDAHMNPAEAVEAHRLVGARRSVGMHWGTFQLTDEAYDAPLAALAAAKGTADFSTLSVGGSHKV